MTHKKTV